VAFDAGLGTGDGGDYIPPTGRDAGYVPPVSWDAGLQQCTGTTSNGQLMPLDMYVMLDKSGSMMCAASNPDCPETQIETGSKWGAVTGALTTFLNQSDVAGISVAIQYFALPDNGVCASKPDGHKTGNGKCSSDADCDPCGPCVTFSSQLGPAGLCMGEVTGDSCTAADYATPDVEFVALPGGAKSIKDSMNAQTPGSSTPTAPALQGAISHASDWAKANSGHVVIVVFATDGEPTECTDVSLDGNGNYVIDQAAINAIAAAGYNGSPRVLTFVIGIQDLGGSNLSALNGIAQAGSGNASGAFLVGGSSDVNQQFVAALNSIRGSVLGCNYQIPPPPAGQTLDFTKVNVQYTPTGGTGETLGYVSTGQSGCSATKDGWYYDNPAKPTQIILCDSTCTKVKNDSGGQVKVQLGCTTVIN
jgi:hypothetical protein